jgi:hypothetical protein
MSEAYKVNNEVRLARRGLGEFSTRDLLGELRLRGDLAMAVHPCSELGADGATLSALAAALLKSSTVETLDGTRGRLG